MKKIKLEVIGLPDKSAIRERLRTYSLFLDWGLTASFRNKKKAVAFQNRLNEWLNDKLFILNVHYSTAFAGYRSVWLYMDREKTTEKRLKRLFINIDLWINQVFDMPGKGPDRAFMLLERLNGIITALIEVYTLLIEVEKRRNNWDNIKIFNYNIMIIEQVKSEIMAYTDPVSQGGKVF